MLTGLDRAIVAEKDSTTHAVEPRFRRARRTAPARRWWQFRLAALTVAGTLVATVPPAASTAPSAEGGGLAPGGSADGVPRPRWNVALDALRRSAVDVGTAVDIDQKTLAWKRTCVTAYEARMSTDRTAWHALYSTVVDANGPRTVDAKGVSRHVKQDAVAR